MTVDVVVVGGGLAGLVAATVAREAGASVTLLEARPELGGSTAMSGGWFAFAGTPAQRDAGVDDHDDAFRAELAEEAAGFADSALLDALVAEQDASRAWLERRGFAPELLTISAGMRRPRSHRYDIAGLLRVLAAGLADDPEANVLTGRAAERLVVDASGRVTGVAAAPTGQVIQARRGVVLATGGFSRSPDLLRRFAPEQLAAIPYGGAGNTGDGLRMAWRLGADVLDVGFVSGTFGSHPLTTDAEHELLSAFYLGAIVVNARGERFADEASSYKAIGASCLEQPGGMGYEVFDARVMAKSVPGAPLSDIRALERKGRIVTADTITALADAAGIDPDGLARTVDDYNAALARGESAGRSGLVNGGGTPTPIDRPPFHAYPAKTLMSSTYGGLRIAPNADVVRVDGTRIRGLTAAGEVTGGFHGPGYMTGSALTKALVFGRIAATTLCGRHP
ncbi:FAD-dependent oxidoreductase [Agromyces mangrovi Wang et al. 2018]|uniref:FAD-dependent oxidoreductase n=1 Tax=Agromyces mangrovi TaxID=1858653 RepID=UPI0025739A71|nr:FAD-dependent oxidoreductase [Agromyces mangrovi]BDZ65357.1 hypothetical protein GCM10025877_22950 [Agromyces mangrovi]